METDLEPGQQQRVDDFSAVRTIDGPGHGVVTVGGASSLNGDDSDPGATSDTARMVQPRIVNKRS
jgi:hypothetical protein